jgi:hypothetical protein
MSNRSATFAKRQREQNLKDKARQREERRVERKSKKEDGPPVEDGVDPDLAGIVAGPQPRPDEEDENAAIAGIEPTPGRSEDTP